jgi:hypothetical protein
MRWTTPFCWWPPTAFRHSITCWARDSGQGQDPHADLALLVRSAQGLVPNHLITADVSEFPAALQPYADQLEGRSMLVKRAAMFPVECVARGYLAGSGWKEYQAGGTVCGIPLPGGLLDGSRLPEPIVYAGDQEPGRRARREHLLCRDEALLGAAMRRNCAG